MIYIGKYADREVYWLDYENFADQLPDKNWVCLAIANEEPDYDIFDKFVRKAILKDVLEFKGHGRFGERLHDLFDETMVIMETLDNHSGIEVMTTWHNDETLADTLWQCFFATCLPDTADLTKVKIVCTDLDGNNRISELNNYLEEFGLDG